MLTIVQNSQGKDKSGETGGRYSALESNPLRRIMWTREIATCRLDLKIYS
jgi:hypothetical protein